MRVGLDLVARGADRDRPPTSFRAMSTRWPGLTLTRAIAVLGRLFVLLGVLVLLFVGYQLWGTGWQEARAQDRLEKQFEEALSTTTTTAEPGSTTTLPDDGEVTDPTATTPVELEQGDAMARIEMPTIGVDKLVVQGTSVSDLRKGPGHYLKTPMPGEPGNSAIAGHRTTYGAPFGEIDQLAPGDQIVVTTLAGRFEYRVIGADRIAPEGDPASGHLIVEPTDVWVLDDYGDHRLTLTACHPKYSARERIIVAAELVEDPVEPTSTAPSSTTTGAGANGGDAGSDDGDLAAATADLDEGLGGDPDARLPAILWGLFFFALLAGAWFVSTRWKRWPSYAVAAVPLLLVMYVWFENLDRWLPAR
jgi:sortase A